ncbi:hypothetical protein SNEBB_005601 [Seison nebaliae]|nr:hypothetical protein SNEBB_005601 [Seison nebaliae]
MYSSAYGELRTRKYRISLLRISRREMEDLETMEQKNDRLSKIRLRSKDLVKENQFVIVMITICIIILIIVYSLIPPSIPREN